MKEFRDRQYGITTSELRCENYDAKREAALKSQLEKTNEEDTLKSIKETIVVVLENAMEMKTNKIIAVADEDMKAAIAYVIVNSDLDKFKKVSMLCEYGVDFVSEGTKEIVKTNVDSSAKKKYKLLDSMKKIIDIDFPFSTGYAKVATEINSLQKKYMMEQFKADGINISPSEISKLINYGYIK